MQLFVTSYVLRGEDTIIITNPVILHQCRKVLRMRLEDSICVQHESIATDRYIIRITAWDDKQLQGTIIQKDICTVSLSQVRMLVAMPNRRDKAELIVQKLSEIGVSAIGFWPAHRSVIKQSNDAKMERLSKIAQEATEQSWGWRVPTVSFVTDVTDWIAGDTLVVFDKTDTPSLSYRHAGTVVGLVGPEGGLAPQDYAMLPKHVVVTLGNTIYRTETASIVGGWYLVSMCDHEKNS